MTTIKALLRMRRIEQYFEFETKTPSGKAVRVMPNPIPGGARTGFVIFPASKEIPVDRWHEHGTGKNGTVLDLIMEVYGLSRAAAKRFLMDDANLIKRGIEQILAEEKHFTPTEEYDEYMIKNVIPSEYYLKRGIGLATQKRFKLGYDRDNIWGDDRQYLVPIFYHDKLYRIIRKGEGVDAHNVNCRKMKDGYVPCFNQEILEDSTVDLIFITEGHADALSIEELGYHAISIDGVGNAGRIAKYLNGNVVEGRTYFIAMDNDEAGIKASLEFSDLSNCHVFKYPKEYKDINEWLVCDRRRLEKLLGKIRYRVRKINER